MVEPVSWWKHIKFFKPEEFLCRCCNEQYMEKDFVLRLDMLRGRMNTPVIVQSGYRCEKHDRYVGGKGNHTTGRAVDISMDGKTAYKILPYLSMIGFTGIGVGIRQGFIHLDDLTKNPRPNIWSY